MDVYRIDDRLVHSQVINTWLSAMESRRLVVADDIAAGDGTLKTIYAMALPPGNNLEIFGIEEAADILKGRGEGEKPILVLIRDIRGLLRLVESGVKIPEVRIGNRGRREGAIRTAGSVFLTAEDTELLRKLEGLGVRIFIQTFFDDDPIPLSSATGWTVEGRDAG